MRAIVGAKNRNARRKYLVGRRRLPVASHAATSPSSPKATCPIANPRCAAVRMISACCAAPHLERLVATSHFFAVCGLRMTTGIAPNYPAAAAHRNALRRIGASFLPARRLRARHDPTDRLSRRDVELAAGRAPDSLRARAARAHRDGARRRGDVRLPEVAGRAEQAPAYKEAEAEEEGTVGIISAPIVGATIVTRCRATTPSCSMFMARTVCS